MTAQFQVVEPVAKIEVYEQYHGYGYNQYRHP